MLILSISGASNLTFAQAAPPYRPRPRPRGGEKAAKSKATNMSDDASDSDLCNDLSFLCNLREFAEEAKKAKKCSPGSQASTAGSNTHIFGADPLTGTITLILFKVLIWLNYTFLYFVFKFTLKILMKSGWVEVFS